MHTGAEQPDELCCLKIPEMKHAKTKAGKRVSQLDYVALLERLTDKRGWVNISGPDSGTGVDYWFALGKSEAIINRDQEWLVVTVDGKTVFDGPVEEAAKI